jgi:hypothetical protein
MAACFIWAKSSYVIMSSSHFEQGLQLRLQRFRGERAAMSRKGSVSVENF